MNSSGTGAAPTVSEPLSLQGVHDLAELAGWDDAKLTEWMGMAFVAQPKTMKELTPRQLAFLASRLHVEASLVLNQEPDAAKTQGSQAGA